MLLADKFCTGTVVALPDTVCPKRLSNRSGVLKIRPNLSAPVTSLLLTPGIEMKAFCHATVVAFLLCLAMYYPPLAEAETLALPATGVWNGFNGQLNVVECLNVGTTSLAAQLELLDNAGTVRDGVPFELAPRATIHLILNSLQYDIRDQYGTYRLSSESASPLLICHTSFYRMLPGGTPKAVEYAFSIPVSNPLKGTVTGIYNAISPDEPSGPIWNWLSIYNPATAPFSAAVEVYGQDGALLETIAVDGLASGERRDIALGHDRGQVTGLYRIVPASGQAPYGAFLSRYGYHDSGRFRFAFPLFPDAGSCDSGPVPASTMGHAWNWGEVANPSGSAVEMSIEVRDRAGSLLFSESTAIAAYSQRHYPLHEFIGPLNVGTVRVRCKQGDAKLLLQSLYYGKLSPAAPNVEWAYASQGGRESAGPGEMAAVALNTFLGAANWTKIQNRGDGGAAVATALFSSAGAGHSTDEVPVAGRGSADHPFHEALGFENVGLGLLAAGANGPAIGVDTLRVFPHASGEIGSIMRVISPVLPQNFSVQPGPNECGDGIDNDGDGATDGADFGCFGPNRQETGVDQGWTILTPSSDSRIVYVSAAGNDNNDGLSPERPVRTIAKGRSLVRHGYPDWLLFKRGEVWEEVFTRWQASGRSETEPAVVASYGDPFAARPQFLIGDENGFFIYGGGGTPAEISHLRVVGLEFYAHTRDPNSPSYTGPGGGSAITNFRAGTDILFEDNLVRFGMFVLQADNGPAYNVRLRRNVVVDNYNISGLSHAQGIYVDNVHGLLLEENVFDHNGWSENGPAGSHATIFNHNIYIQTTNSGITLRGNIIARASSHGSQVRPGGTVEGNLYLRNSLALFVGRSASTVRNNVILDAKDINADTPRGHGIEVLGDTPSAVVTDNIVAHKTSSVAPWYPAYQFKGYQPNAVMQRNIAYNWNGAALEVEGTYGSLTISENILQEFANSRLAVYLWEPVQAGLVLANNTYYTVRGSENWFRIGEEEYGLNDWRALTGDVSSTAGQPNFLDPGRDMGTYQRDIGAAVHTLEGFLAEARKQSRTNWREAYSAAAAIAYIKEGFTVVP